jgi:hypothetical protein
MNSCIISGWRAKSWSKSPRSRSGSAALIATGVDASRAVS